MPTTASTNFVIKITGVYWDTGYDPNNPWDVNTPDATEFDEHGYWYWAGESDGRQKTGSKVDFIPDPYKYNYQQGYNDGSWKRLVMIQN